MDDLIVKEKVTLDTPPEEVEQRLLTENNIDELNNIINVFNLNIKRKDLIRTSKLNDLQDKITDQMTKRLEKNAGEFSNKDLLDYFKVLQEKIDKPDNTLDTIDTPAIQINQQVNINTSEDELSRESREKVKDIVSQILANSAYTVDDLTMPNIVDVEEEK